MDLDHVHRGLTWLGKVRLRVAVFIIGIPLATLGAISIGPAWLTLPLVGVAVAAVTVTLGRLSDRLAEARCWTCGTDLSGRAAHEHGVVCPSCGSLNQHNPARLAEAEAPDDENGAAPSA